MSTIHESTHTSAVSNASSASASTTPIVVKSPPEDANIPAVPQGAEPTNGTDYRGIVPKKTELAVLGAVVEELQNSTEFSALFGRTMPSLTYIIQVFTAANEWSLMRNKTDAWDLYSRTQEGLTWVTARALMSKMKPVFDATAGVNSDVATQFPSLGQLLTAAAVIAKRGATTRKENAKNRAKGEAPTRGPAARKLKAAVRVVADHAAAPPSGPGTAATAPAAVTATTPSGGGAVQAAPAQAAPAQAAPSATAPAVTVPASPTDGAGAATHS